MFLMGKRCFIPFVRTNSNKEREYVVRELFSVPHDN